MKLWVKWVSTQIHFLYIKVISNELFILDQMMESGLITPVKAPFLNTPLTPNLPTIIEVTASSTIWGSRITNDTNTIIPISAITKHSKKPSLQIDPSLLCQREYRYAASFSRQLSILLMRTFLILWRDKSLTTLRILIHALMGLFVGILYYGIGNDAGNIFNNFRYIFFTIMFVMYTSFSSMILNCMY